MKGNGTGGGWGILAVCCARGATPATDLVHTCHTSTSKACFFPLVSRSRPNSYLPRVQIQPGYLPCVQIPPWFIPATHPGNAPVLTDHTSRSYQIPPWIIPATHPGPVRATCRRSRTDSGQVCEGRGHMHRAAAALRLEKGQICGQICDVRRYTEQGRGCISYAK